VKPLVSKNPDGAPSADEETRAQENQVVVAGHGEKSEVDAEETRWSWAAKEAMARRLRLLGRR